MTADPLPVLRAVAEAWDQTIAPEFGTTTHCIEAAKIGRAALARLGVEARPYPCAIVIANSLAAQLTDRAVPVADWPPAAWSVGVDPDARQSGAGWDGHMLLAGAGWLADLSARQFNRPPRINIAAWAAPTDADPTLPQRLTNGTLRLDIYPRPELARWRNGSAWRQPVPADWLARLLAAARERLAGPA